VNTLAPIVASLHAILSEEYLLSGELLAHIGQEKQHLERGDQAALQQAVLSKQTLLDRLQAVTAQRLDLVGTLGDGLPVQWSATLQEFPALARQHALLLDLVQQLRAENNLLGQLLQRKTQFVSSVLARLQPGPAAGSLYHSNGSRLVEGGHRKLVSV